MLALAVLDHEFVLLVVRVDWQGSASATVIRVADEKWEFALALSVQPKDSVTQADNVLLVLRHAVLHRMGLMLVADLAVLPARLNQVHCQPVGRLAKAHEHCSGTIRAMFEKRQ